MSNTMFCFQCEQTAACRGCTGQAGVCGKKADTARLQDRLTGALVGLARTAVDAGSPADPRRDDLVARALFATLTNVNFDNDSLTALLDRVEETRAALATGSVRARDNFDMDELWNADEDSRSLRSLILFGIRGVAAYAHHAAALGCTDAGVNDFLLEALVAVGRNDLSVEELLPTVMKVGEINFRCMALLDRANTGSYGDPVPTDVDLTVEPGPFIVVSGHDLHDLKLLLEQTEGSGINVYTHGEMLPAHAYPGLKKHAHLKGHFGTAWQNQVKEFADLPATVLFTTNCLMPPKESCADRVFTTGVVSYPGLVHIGPDRNFAPLVARARELGGYAEPRRFTGLNGGHRVTTGFGRNALLSAADKVVDAVRSGAIRHFFLVGGCDGARPGRNYYTEFVRATPPDSVVLTLACGKFRFNDLDLGTVAGLPRLMDMGQCNDAYGAIRVALALAEAFHCGVNDLPLSLVLSWYEQKAVCILLTLLHLGVRNILLGPSLPAFVSPNVLDLLVKNHGIAPIGTPEEDLKTLLARHA